MTKTPKSPKKTQKKAIHEHHVGLSIDYKTRLQGILSGETHSKSPGNKPLKTPKTGGRLKMPQNKNNPNKAGNNVMVSSGIIKKSDTQIESLKTVESRRQASKTPSSPKSKFSFSGVKPSPKLFPSSKTAVTKIEKTPSSNQVNTKVVKTPTDSTKVVNTGSEAHADKPKTGTPVTVRNNETLFSAFDKPKEYEAIRAGKSLVPRDSTPNPVSAGKAPKTPVKGANKMPSSGSNGGAKPPSKPGGKGNKPPPPGKGNGKTPDSSYHTEDRVSVPAHPTHSTQTYSPFKAFSNMFSSPATARVAASIRGGMSNKQIYRPSALTLRKSESSTVDELDSMLTESIEK